MFAVYIKTFSKDKLIGPFKTFSEACKYTDDLIEKVKKEHKLSYYTSAAEGWYVASFNTNDSKYDELPHEVVVKKLFHPNS